MVGVAGRPVPRPRRPAPRDGGDLGVQHRPVRRRRRWSAWRAHFERLLEAVVADPDRPIDELPLLDEAERAAVLEDVERDRAAGPRRPGWRRSWPSRRRGRPERVAVRVRRPISSPTRELDARANQLAHRLRALGAGAGRAGRHLPASAPSSCPWRCSAMLKAGAAYVPIDPGLPGRPAGLHARRRRAARARHRARRCSTACPSRDGHGAAASTATARAIAAEPAHAARRERRARAGSPT